MELVEDKYNLSIYYKPKRKLTKPGFSLAGAGR